MKALDQHDGIVRTKKVYSAESVSQTCLSVRPPMIPLPPSNENLTPAFFFFFSVVRILSLLKKKLYPIFPPDEPCGWAKRDPVWASVFPGFSFGYPRWNPQASFVGDVSHYLGKYMYTCTSGR